MTMDSAKTVENRPLPPDAIQELRGRLRGMMLQPGDDGYDDARRIQNGLIDRRPALIMRCSGTADVVEAVNFARDHGASIDNLRSVEIVTADGQVRTANDRQNPNLFWAVRGAGSNFAVVTSFEFRVHPLGPQVQLCAPFYPLEEGRNVLRAWRDFTASAPDEVNSLAIPWSVPDAEGFPPELRRRPVVIVAAVYAGPADEGARVMQPLRELGKPLLDLSGTLPFTALQAAFDPFFPKGNLYYWKSTYVHDLSDPCIDAILDGAAKRPSHMPDIPIWHLGGAMSRVAENHTAYGRRDAPYLVTAEATWIDPQQNDRYIQWARDLLAALQPFSRGGLYLNFPGFGEEKEAMLRASYGSNYDRLAGLKTQYDPGNLFRMNLNIRPADMSASA